MRRLKWLALSTGVMIGSTAIAADPEIARPALEPAAHHPLPPLPSQRIEAELAYLRTALKITDAQTQQWNALAEVLRGIAKHKDAKVQAMRAEIDGQVERPQDPIAMLERRQQRLAEESSDIGALLAVAKPLYASLGADQRKAADGLLPPIGGPLPMGPPPFGPPPIGRPFLD